MSRLVTLVRRARAILRRLRFERISFQWQPIDEVVANAPDGVRWLGPQALGADIREALYCHPPASVTYRFEAQPGDRCVAGCSLLPNAWNRNLGGAEFAIAVQAADGQLLRRRTRIADPGSRARDRRWRDLRVRVPARRPQDVRVTLTTRVPGRFAGDSAWAIWGSPGVERRRPLSDVIRLAATAARGAARVGARHALRGLGLAGPVDDRTPEYRAWVRAHAPTPEALAHMATEASTLSYQPLISILTPVHNTPPDLLRACAASVLAQVYPRWEWCICDDASSSEATKAAVAELTDPRIRKVGLAQNAGIVAASQAALAAASGEFVALLDHDDELTPDALYRVARRLNESPDADVLYSDEDKLDEDGGVSEPFFKPDWSPEHLLSSMYTCHLTVARKALVDRVGGFRAGTDGAQDHDLMLRLMELTDRVEHVPDVLYHWRRAAGSTASPGAKPWAFMAGQRAVSEYLRRNGLGSEAIATDGPGCFRPRLEIRGQPRVLIVVVGGTEEVIGRCAEGLRSGTACGHYQIAGAASAVVEINTVIREHDSDYVVLLDAALEPADGEWLVSLLEFAQQPAIGAVGGKIQYADGRWRHIGLILGAGDGVARVLHLHHEKFGYFASAIGVRNYSAVSGECLMTRRGLFEELQGFDERLPWSVADVDYCLRVRRTGRRVVFTPHAAFHVRGDGTPAPLPDAEAIAALRAHWGAALDADPFYNRNLNRERADYRLGTSSDHRVIGSSGRQ